MAHDLQRVSPRIKRSDGPYAIVLLPTRELVLQSFEVLQKLFKPFIWIVPGMVMGGEDKSSEKARLRKGINVLVGTPGRMLDHIQNTTCLKLGLIRWLILDEAYGARFATGIHALRQEFTLADAIGSHGCSVEALPCLRPMLALHHGFCSVRVRVIGWRLHVRCVLGRNLHSRIPLVPSPARLKLLHVCDQCKFLSSVYSSHRLAL
jgi:hypothetical protein